MLLMGQTRARTCGTIDRRAVLQVGASSVLGLSLADLLQLRAAAAKGDGYLPARAKSVILLWLWGGPSQLDTFDPKPNAPLEYRGPFGTIPTRTPGVRFAELFPRLAGISNRFALIRSMYTLSNDHGVAGTIGLTGSAAGGTGLDGKALPGAPRPALGSVVARARAGSPLPSFFVVGGKLHQGKKPIIGEGGGVLGAKYDPFRLEYDPLHGTRVPALQLPDNLTPERLTDRRTLHEALDAAEKKSQRAALDQYRAQALAMLTSPSARSMFDLTQEPAALLDGYGRTRFGQSCALARRLVENGVPFVQVNWSDHVEAEEDAGDGGWDHHYRNFQIMADRHAPWLDQGVQALLDDLHRRGLLETTLVIAVGEFGRAPKINVKAGRDHWEKCYCALVAGAGVAGGRVVGESDARAENPKENPLTPADLVATVQHAVGISSEQAVALGLTTTGRVVEELFA